MAVLQVMPSEEDDTSMRACTPLVWLRQVRLTASPTYTVSPRSSTSQPPIVLKSAPIVFAGPTASSGAEMLELATTASAWSDRKLLRSTEAPPEQKGPGCAKRAGLFETMDQTGSVRLAVNRLVPSLPG